MNKRYQLILVALLVLIGSQAVAQRKLSIQERLTRLEQQAGGAGNTSNTAQNAGDLVIQVQQLQAQLAEMQGLLEEQNYQIEELKKRQKVLYVDIDSRIAALEGGNVNPTVSQNNSPTMPVDGSDQTSVVVSQPVPEVRAPIEAGIQTTTITGSNVEASTNAVDPQAEGLYERAFSELKSGRFTESARLFEDFIQRYPSHELTDNSYYWLGESHYVSRNYPLALAAFQTLEDQFPLSSKLADALLKIGYTYHELEDYNQAQLALNKVITSFPGTSVSRLAENRLNLLRREGKIN
ncbi:tol-pal system protein YbgF [Marinicella sp. W31]|uniref:tol-pal system protein YbgF n=1 Tax=Marinicella sp. W31 TaxID=3023713 RepID=UPI003756EF78